MGKVVDLKAFKKRLRKKDRWSSLTDWLRLATLLRQGMEEFNEAIVVMDFLGLKRAFEARFSDIILKNKNIGVDFFLCGNYISALLTETANTPPESWYAVDYFIKAEEENNPIALRQGANVCFLIYAIFPLRGQIRCMKLSDYEAMARGMYYNYHGRTGIKVAYFMSQQFKPMAKITRECLKELR